MELMGSTKIFNKKEEFIAYCRMWWIPKMWPLKFHLLGTVVFLWTHVWQHCQTTILLQSLVVGQQICKYRFPSLFEVDTFFKYWSVNFETANKKANTRLSLKDWFFKKGSFGPRTSETIFFLRSENNSRWHFLH